MIGTIEIDTVLVFVLNVWLLPYKVIVAAFLHSRISISTHIMHSLHLPHTSLFMLLIPFLESVVVPYFASHIMYAFLFVTSLHLILFCFFLQFYLPCVFLWKLGFALLETFWFSLLVIAFSRFANQRSSQLQVLSVLVVTSTRIANIYATMQLLSEKLLRIKSFALCSNGN